jgi:hypothetical protein
MPVSRTERKRWCAVAAFATLALLSGCKDEKKGAPAAMAGADQVRLAAEQNIRAGTPSVTQMTFRGMQVYAQAIPQRFAVCGQVDPFPDDSRMFVPFVTIVSVLDNGADGKPRYKFEQYVGTTTMEAGRVYLAMVNYCYDKGGPGNGPIPSVMPMAPLPVGIPDPAAKTPPPDSSPSPPAASLPSVSRPLVDSSQAGGSVTTRQNANLHSDPHGPTIRTVAAGTVLRIYATAAGGWYQVGDTAPWGWIHESMLDKH